MKKILVVDDMSGWRDHNTNSVYEILGNNVTIDEAESATDAYSLVLQNITKPYDIVITDLQMEDDYSPKLAGEWLIEQIKTLPQYYKTKYIIISASYNIKIIAESLGTDYIRKSTALKFLTAYEELLKI